MSGSAARLVGALVVLALAGAGTVLSLTIFTERILTPSALQPTSVGGHTRTRPY